MRLTIALLSSLLCSACLVESEPGEPGDSDDESAEAEALAKAAPKVDVCHIPPGNPANAHTITVGHAAVQAHLAHGDTLGACGGGGCVPSDEVCGDGLDNDCDEQVDEGCCAASPEACGDGVDNDCDGEVDEGCLGDLAWNDANRNGIQDAGELPVAGVTILLRSGTTGALVQVASSNASGNYYLTGVPPGTYYLEVVAPAGLTPTGSDAGTDDHLDSDFDGETATTPVFFFSGAADDSWDAGMYAVIQS